MTRLVRSCYNCTRGGCAGCSESRGGITEEGADRPSHWDPCGSVEAISEALGVTEAALHLAADLLVRNLRHVLCFRTEVLNADLTQSEQREVSAIVGRLLERAADEKRVSAAAAEKARVSLEIEEAREKAAHERMKSMCETKGRRPIPPPTMP